MTVDKEFLLQQLASFEAQKAEALAVANMAEGGIQTVKGLIARLEQDEPEP